MLQAASIDKSPVDGLDAAVEALDPVVALLALIQITGDRTLLDRYGPALDGTQDKMRSGFTDIGDVEIPKEVAAEVAADVRDRLRKAVTAGKQPVLSALDKPLFRRMARLALGLDVPEMSIDPAFQHAGFTTDTRIRKPLRTPPADFKVLVVGAGMMGINLAVKLQQAGFDFTVVERLDAVGGNWLENTYPGAAVDTPSRDYSYSFQPNASWTKYFPTGPEFLSYLAAVTDKYNLESRIDFTTTVSGAAWDADRQRWTVQAQRDGKAHIYEANVLIMATGPNNNPNYPKVENLDKFEGPVMHSARWDHSVDLKGKKVVLVGTGCSGIQVSTAIADTVGEMVIVQRQPEHIMPNAKSHQPVDAMERAAMEMIPFAKQWMRLQSLVTSLRDMRGMIMKDEVHAAETGGFSPLNDGMKAMCEGYLKSHFPDNPKMVALLTPQYPVFGKRPALDCGFYDTLKKPNVSILRGALTAADEKAVILSDGTRIECDAVLLCTGYNLHFGRQFDIKGEGGRTLTETFEPFPFSYEGMLVPHFPNFVLMGGPYSFLVANHAVVSEQQTHYVIELLQWMTDEALSSVDVSEKATIAWVEQVDADLQKSAWVLCGNAHGYYRDKGQKVILAVPKHNSRIWHETREPRTEDFNITRRRDAQPVQLREMEMLSI